MAGFDPCAGGAVEVEVEERVGVSDGLVFFILSVCSGKGERSRDLLGMQGV